MKIDEIKIKVPKEAIAQLPLDSRSSSKLFVIDRKAENKFIQTTFNRILAYFKPGDVLVLNNTRVIPARLYMKRKTGAKIEVLLVEKDGAKWEVMLTKAGRLKNNERLIIDEGVFAIVEKHDDKIYIIFEGMDEQDILDKYGYAPLPPYIKRNTSKLREDDLIRYQTVYADKGKAIAVPTAGLHFTVDLLNQLKNSGVVIKYIRLDVGAGTFIPIKTEKVEDHKMHSERFTISFDTINEINKAKREGRRVFCVGTTTVRVLESLAESKGTIIDYNSASFNDDVLDYLKVDDEGFTGSTRLFIYPGYKFNIVDSMITNFHLPEGTPLLLVCALAGKQVIEAAYKDALNSNYRFYSYGDSMLIL